MEGHDRQRYKAWHRMMMMILILYISIMIMLIIIIVFKPPNPIR